MKKDVFAQRDMTRRSKRKRLLALYVKLLEGDSRSRDAVIKEVMELRNLLFIEDPAETEEPMKHKKRRPRLPA
ncbi:hypothetical protein [Paenibacillus chibensis]|uniref:hypothetical protein n=1 Tax=Paenibacillus chibensis TaxID=59846 RepID=UPI000FDA68A1|nr:hypothetical protein [Paenibacillus chibensis]MEC0370859.1 hypothetical protein [Paenibacillus chibensis]